MKYLSPSASSLKIAILDSGATLSLAIVPSPSPLGKEEESIWGQQGGKRQPGMPAEMSNEIKRGKCCPFPQLFHHLTHHPWAANTHKSGAPPTISFFSSLVSKSGLKWREAERHGSGQWMATRIPIQIWDLLQGSGHSSWLDIQCSNFPRTILQIDFAGGVLSLMNWKHSAVLLCFQLWLCSVGMI